MTEATTPEPQLNRAGRRAESRRLRKTGAVMAAIPAAFGTTALLLGATTVPAGAATLTVNSLGNAGDGTCDVSPGECTLRDALDDAADGDTIVFQAGLTGDIDLATELTVEDSVDIQGPGAGVIAIDGQSSTRIFNVSIGGGASGAFTVSGLTLKNGSTAGGGAAILMANEDLTVTDVDFVDNATSGLGGAILANNPGTDISISGANFTNNDASDGGGALRFAAGDSLTILNSTFTGSDGSDYGGAVYAEYLEGAIEITGSTFTDNDADGGGGALAVFRSNDITIAGSTFTGNRALGGPGGGLYLDSDGIVIVSDTVISGNAADEEGGGAKITNVASVSVSGTTVTGNTSVDDGGGLYIAYVLGAVAIADSEISDNAVTDEGSGGVRIKSVDGTVSISGTSVIGNTAYNYGGGLYISEIVGDTTISFSTIAGNTANGSGGGIEMFETVGALIIENSTVSGNVAGHRGGGMYLTEIGGGTRISNSTISGNRAGYEGGGIAFTDYYGLTIFQSTITGNSATSIGGIYLPANDKSVSVSGAEHGAHAGDGVAAAGEQVGPGVVTLVGTIVAGNAGADIGVAGTVTASHSLLGVISGTTLVDQGGNLFGVDPLLGPLQDNGGPTQTHALLDGSPAINAGPDPVADFPGNADDQRGPGYPRVVGGRVDIGAFEVQPTNIEPTFTG